MVPGLCRCCVTAVQGTGKGVYNIAVIRGFVFVLSRPIEEPRFILLGHCCRLRAVRIRVYVYACTYTRLHALVHG